jgi:hypothetical protein
MIYLSAPQRPRGGRWSTRGQDPTLSGGPGVYMHRHEVIMRPDLPCRCPCPCATLGMSDANLRDRKSGLPCPIRSIELKEMGKLNKWLDEIGEGLTWGMRLWAQYEHVKWGLMSAETRPGPMQIYLVSACKQTDLESTFEALWNSWMDPSSTSTKKSRPCKRAAAECMNRSG